VSHQIGTTQLPSGATRVRRAGLWPASTLVCRSCRRCFDS